MARDPVTDFRMIGLAEGLSFLVLLGIAMPLKYLAGQPWAVRLVGTIHGGLFVIYLLALVRAAWHARWSFLQVLEALAAAFIPFGPIYLDRKLRRETPRPAGDLE